MRTTLTSDITNLLHALNTNEDNSDIRHYKRVVRILNTNEDNSDIRHYNPVARTLYTNEDNSDIRHYNLVARTHYKSGQLSHQTLQTCCTHSI